MLLMVALPMAFHLIESRHSAINTTCKSQIYQLAFAMHVYAEKYGTLPPAIVYEDGVPMHSWRVLLMEFLDPDVFRAYDFSQPWNSDHNLALETKASRFFQCPWTDGAGTATCYCLVVGSDCVISDGEVQRKITDVPPESILIVETKRRDIHWMSPVDLSYDELIEMGQQVDDVVGGPDTDGGHYATCESCWYSISETTPNAILERTLASPAKDSQQK